MAKQRFQINNLFINCEDAEDYNISPTTNTIDSFGLPSALEDVSRLKVINDVERIGEEPGFGTEPEPEPTV